MMARRTSDDFPSNFRRTSVELPSNFRRTSDSQSSISDQISGIFQAFFHGFSEPNSNDPDHLAIAICDLYFDELQVELQFGLRRLC